MGPKLTQMPLVKDDFLDVCSSPPVVVKLTDLVLAAWVSRSPSAFYFSKKKKANMILDTQHSTFETNPAIASAAWGGF